MKVMEDEGTATEHFHNSFSRTVCVKPTMEADSWRQAMQTND